MVIDLSKDVATALLSEQMRMFLPCYIKVNSTFLNGIMYFFSMTLFTIGRTSPPSRLTIGWSEIQLLLSHFCKWWTTALPSMTIIWCFSSFCRWIIKLLYLFLHLLNQISLLKNNCNALNFFLPFLVIIIRGQRIVREQSENGQSILWPLSQLGPIGGRPRPRLVNPLKVIIPICFDFSAIFILCVARMTVCCRSLNSS